MSEHESCVYKVQLSLGSSFGGGNGPYGGDWSALCRGGDNNTKVTFQWFARKFCKCEPFRACDSVNTDAANDEGPPPRFEWIKCYDLGDCDPDVVCQRYSHERGEVTVDFAGCPDDMLKGFCRCMAAAEAWCGPLEDYWSNTGPYGGNGCVRWARAEFYECLNRLRGDGKSTGALPKCMEDAISSALDDLLGPGTTSEGIQDVKDFCAGKDMMPGGSAGLQNRIGTSIREQQEARKQQASGPQPQGH